MIFHFSVITSLLILKLLRVLLLSTHIEVNSRDVDADDENTDALLHSAKIWGDSMLPVYYFNFYNHVLMYVFSICITFVERIFATALFIFDAKQKLKCLQKVRTHSFGFGQFCSHVVLVKMYHKSTRKLTN